jgi:hypothetical protein
MARLARFVWDKEGYNALRNSPEVVNDITRRAKAVAERAEGMGVECQIVNRSYPRKAIAVVSPKGAESARRNASDNTILKSVDAGRK